MHKSLMKKSINCSLALILATAVAGQIARCADREWNTYQPGNNACSIKFPANPEYQTQQADGMIVHVYIAKDPSQNPPATYALSFGDFAKGKIPDEKDAAAKVLDTERNNFVKAVNGKLISEKPATVESFPGHELVVQSEDGKSRFTVREYLAGTRVFHLIAWAPAARPDSAADAGKFFDSFQTGTK